MPVLVSNGISNSFSVPPCLRVDGLAVLDFVDRNRAVPEHQRHQVRDRIESLFDARMRRALGRADQDVVDAAREPRVRRPERRFVEDLANLLRAC